MAAGSRDQDANRTRLAGLLVLGIAVAMRWLAASRGADNVDSIYYARALDRYSLLELRPYFPGFPLYVGAARLARWLVADRYLALHLVSATASALALWPIALIAADWRGWGGGDANATRRSALTAALLWAVMPLACVTGTEIASEPMALVFGLLMMWCSGRVVHGQGGAWPAAAGFLGGLMLGVRLLHVFVLGPVLAAAWAAWRRGGRPVVRSGVALGLMAGIVPWLAWQVAHEGKALLQAARSLVSLHLGVPEHSLASDPQLLRRVGDFLLNVYENGLGFWTPRAPGGLARAVLTVALAALIVKGALRLRTAPPGVRRLAVLWAFPFAAYVIAGQDVTHARYAFPLAAVAVVLAGMGAEGRWGTIAAVAAAVAACAVTLGLASEHRGVEPTEFQLARALSRRHSSEAALLVLDNQRMMTVILGEHAPAIRSVWSTPEGIGPLTAALESEGLDVYSTMPDPNAPNRWMPIETFVRPLGQDQHSAPELWLFHHDRSDPAASPP